MNQVDVVKLQKDLAAYGLLLRGWFDLQAGESVRGWSQPTPPVSICLVGTAGSEFWPQFQRSSQYQDGLANPLDRWSQSIAEMLAQPLQALALMPSDGPPFHPFQQWAQRAEALQASPLMLHIHPQYGLWHAYRFALALPQRIEPPLSFAAQTAPLKANLTPGASQICANCQQQPCLQACPVDAFDGKSYQVQRCLTHLHSQAGQPCMQQGCQARMACPIGLEWRYQPDHATFHMQAFSGKSCAAAPK